MVSERRSAVLESGLSVLILAPMVAHLTWRPAAVLLGGPLAGVAPAVSVAAVAVAALGCLAALRPERWLGLVGAAVALGLGLAIGGGAGGLSLLGVLLCAGVVLPRMVTPLSACHAAVPPSRAGQLAWVGSALLCLAASVSFATYFGDPWAEGYGLAADATLYRHFCASAYFHAAELLAAGVDNVYDLALVPSEASDTLPDSAAAMAPFQLDRYGYPPQFILLPLALRAVVGDFAAQRAAWTCANTLLFAAVLWRAGLWVGPRSGRVLRATAPLIWLGSTPTFQSGNVQLSVLGLGLLAMLAIDEGRDRDGGALLAGVTLAKIAPGLLGVLLLVQRRWRAVGWTVIAAGTISVVSLGVLGPGVFEAFLGYHMPRISTGEAYNFLDDTPRLIYENLAPFGIPFKLAALGMDLDPWRWGARVASAYTALVFVLTILAGRRILDRRGYAAVWLLVLTIAGLRSPMSPGYLLTGVVMALALAAAERWSPQQWLTSGLLLAAMAVTTPFLSMLPLWVALLGQAVLHGTIVWLLLRPWPPLDAEHPPHPLGQG